MILSILKANNMKKLLLQLIFLLILFPAISQTIIIDGVITDSATNNPVPNHAVILQSDSSVFYYYNTVYTNQSGYYSDSSIVVPNGSSGVIYVRTADCNNNLLQATVNYTPAVTHYTQDFQICNSVVQCHALYTYTPAQADPQNIQFQDLSSGNVVSWLWSFSDPTSGTSNFSTLQNPIHYFSSLGHYNVCLTIQGADSLCHDTYCDTVLVDTTSGPCHAAFTVTHDSVNSDYTYHFSDQSTGNINYWSWSFGDGQYSSVQNPVHTYLQPGIYMVHLFIGSTDSTCWDNAFDTLFVGNGTGCQANFYYYSDSTGSNQTVHFFDISTGNPTNWNWNFDDPVSGSSNVSTVQNPLHIFTGPGTFTVCLTISGDSCSSTYCKDIVIPDSVTYLQIYGQVFAGNFPLQEGLAVIFSLDSNQNSIPYVNTSMIDSSGVYYFTQVPDGDYVINAIPILPSGYLPTYYGDVITWEQATHILLGVPNNPYNIHLVLAGSLVPGPGSVSGQINAGKISNSMIDKITMTLMDTNRNPISFSRVNTNGEFDFPALDYGTYYLHPEMAGITSDIVIIEITPAKPHVDVIMTFTGTRILGIGDIRTGKEKVFIYPNPVTDLLNVSFDLQRSTVIRIDVYTIKGQVVYTTSKHVNKGQSTVDLPFSGLNEGIYIVKIHSDDGINIVKRVIKSR